jgi:hypothetical protein
MTLVVPAPAVQRATCCVQLLTCTDHAPCLGHVRMCLAFFSCLVCAQRMHANIRSMVVSACCRASDDSRLQDAGQRAVPTALVLRTLCSAQRT